jgi:hypothetical protein
MGSTGRTSLARILLLSVVLSGLAPGPRAALAGAVDDRRTPPPGSATLPARGPISAGAGSFVPGRVLVAFEPGAGERGRRVAAAAVDGQILSGTGRTGVVTLDRDADVRAAARRLAARPGVAFAEPDWIRRVDTCDRRCAGTSSPGPASMWSRPTTTTAPAPAGPWPWSTPGWRPGSPTWPGRSASAGAAPTPAARARTPRPPAPTAPRWPAWSPPSTTAPAPPASPPAPPSSPTGSTPPAAASPSPTCTRPWPGSPSTAAWTWST